jgi:hypothetical protein
MDIMVDKKRVRKLRNQRAWSQDHLRLYRNNTVSNIGTG